MPKNRPEVNEPRKGSERTERDERGRFTEQEDVGRSPRRGASRDLERGNMERENRESDFGPIDVDLEPESSDR